MWHEKEMAFTGDALLVRGCGRTDFQEGKKKPNTLRQVNLYTYMYVYIVLLEHCCYVRRGYFWL